MLDFFITKVLQIDWNTVGKFGGKIMTILIFTLIAHLVLIVIITLLQRKKNKAKQLAELVEVEKSRHAYINI